VLRQRPCSESRSRKNGLNGKPEKRPNSQNGKGWKRNFRENRKKRKSGRKKNNARGTWLIDSKRIMLPPWNRPGVETGRKVSCHLHLLLPMRR